MDRTINTYSIDRLPRWLEAPLDEGSIENSKIEVESNPESYIFHDSTTKGRRVMKRYEAGVVYETTHPLNDDSNTTTESRLADEEDLMQLGLVLQSRS